MIVIIRVLFILLLCNICESLPKTNPKSPYNQYLPECKNGTYPVIEKKTKIKGIVCPMIKDEIGFLSEWAAFYEMQGFDHIIFYDNNSTTSFAELDPWIKTGFVTIERDWWVNDTSVFKKKKNTFNDMMRIKWMAEIQCKLKAIEWGYEIFISVDMDEYVFPTTNDMTVMDELAIWFNQTARGFALIDKLQFPPTPHILEPINLLTIEAYQTKYPEVSKMNYYNSISPKVALRLQRGEEYTAATSEYVVYCCDFHGCKNFGFHRNCHDLYKAGEMWKLTGKHKKWMGSVHMHHYARSMEKYIMKQGSWDTAAPNRGYDIYNFLDRVSGFEYDDSAVPWGCQLRQLLRERTGEPDYLRPGDMWYRNPEFGRTVSDPHKRGRNGAGYGKYVQAHEWNPYPEGETYQRAHKPYVAANPAEPAVPAAVPTD